MFVTYGEISQKNYRGKRKEIKVTAHPDALSPVSQNRGFFLLSFARMPRGATSPQRPWRPPSVAASWGRWIGVRLHQAYHPLLRAAASLQKRESPTAPCNNGSALAGFGIKAISVTKVFFELIADFFPALYEIAAFIVFAIIKIPIPPALGRRFPKGQGFTAMGAFHFTRDRGLVPVPVFTCFFHNHKISIISQKSSDKTESRAWLSGPSQEDQPCIPI